MKYLIVTGLSGAGKTACVRYLEDRGSFCMDNIPPVMLPKLLEAFDTTQTRWQTVTIAVDARSGCRRRRSSAMASTSESPSWQRGWSRRVSL